MNNSGLLSDTLILSDLDGTLKPYGKEIPEKNLKAIEKYQLLGGNFGLCTGRSIAAADYAIGHLDITNCPSVVFGGGTIYSYPEGKTYFSTSLSASARCRFFEIMTKFPTVETIAYIDCKSYCLRGTNRAIPHLNHNGVEYKVTPVEALPLGDWNKVVFIGEPEEISEIINYTDGIDITNEDYHFAHTEKILCEILPKEADKGKGLTRLAEIMGISIENVYGVGDFYNDIDMLKAAGVSVVVGDANDDIKQYADYITCNCEDGALADLIEHIIKERT